VSGAFWHVVRNENGMAEGTCRICPRCQTRNRHYMLVCARCGRSLERVALTGKLLPPIHAGKTRGLGMRFALGILGLWAGVALAFLLGRVLRSSGMEGEAAASSAAGAKDRPSRLTVATPRPAGDWQTLEERWAEVERESVARAVPAESTPTASPVPPPPVATPVGRPSAVPVPAAERSAAPAPVTQPPAAPASVAPSDATAHKPRPLGRTADADEARARLRSARRAALRRAEARLRSLERRADELRSRTDDDPDEYHERRRARAKVLRDLEDAERQLIRAQWALRKVEP
jgi:hypothetical protein